MKEGWHEFALDSEIDDELSSFDLSDLGWNVDSNTESNANGVVTCASTSTGQSLTPNSSGDDCYLTSLLCERFPLCQL